ncbi:hypothetical protein JIN84_21120 [Luteolibacter yonseiensis]|uniref:Uncharacterized protein n=1 Tax=Luteolibacter yonseiensis TaxID=1144680 RepID=A0A934VCA8_9BACT|nr:hypothetical protein [Luteolibacter yonseiensis]MBK1818138.1 hypothetical protein [Luteolibacter yonseiensis]
MDFHRLPAPVPRPSFRRVARRCLVFITSLLMTGASLAQEAVFTTPRGIYTVKVAGTSEPSIPARTYLGIQLLPETRFRGVAMHVAGDRLSFHSFPSGNLENPSADRKYYLHVLSGAGRGYIANIREFLPSAIVCTEDVTPWIRPGDLVTMRSHPQLSDLLGTGNRFGLGAGIDAGTADNVVIWDPELQKERVYFFHSIRNRWEEKDIEANASNAVFNFPYGFYIVRRSPGTIRIALAGEMSPDAILLPVRSGANVFSLPLNLSASLDRLFPSNGPYPVIGGPNAKSSDLLIFEEPTTGIHRGPFYRLSQPDFSGWREVGVDDSTASIQPLDFLSTLILRREGDSGHVLVEGSVAPPAVPIPVLPAEPEPDEIPLTAELPTVGLNIPPGLPGDINMAIETSTDLSSWTTFGSAPPVDGVVKFTLPAGQTRFFYRLKLTLSAY